jgi:hypothetical protein
MFNIMLKINNLIREVKMAPLNLLFKNIENENYAFFLLPYLSKLLFKALSVGNIEPIKKTSCT